MICNLVLLAATLIQTTSTSAPSQQPPQTKPAPIKADAEISAKLISLRRVYVDSFGDDPVAKQLQALIITSLTESKRVIVTENREKADAILKGTGIEKSSHELHSIGEGTSVGVAGGGSHSEVSGSGGSISGSSSGGFLARELGTSDSQASTETVNDARLSIRLVSPDGDVLWSTAKESHGAKYKGASADVADQVVKQLIHDLDKLVASQQ